MAIKKRVLILGASGMLGSALYDVLRHRYDLILAVRNTEKLKLLDAVHGGVAGVPVHEFDVVQLHEEHAAKKGSPSVYLTDFVKRVGPIDYVINAIGITIPFAMKDVAQTFFVNGALPHILAAEFGEKLIHITTDCAFNGLQEYPYTEESARRPIDIYGMSKAVGEPTSCLTLRTSIIGRELDGKTGLLEWFLQQEGKTIKGYSNHFWNGVTTKEFANICDRIMSSPEAFPKTGLYHVFSNPVSKYEMLQTFKEKFGINCTIEKDEMPRLNRTLDTIHEVNKNLNIPSFKEMVEAI